MVAKKTPCGMVFALAGGRVRARISDFPETLLAIAYPDTATQVQSAQSYEAKVKALPSYIHTVSSDCSTKLEQCRIPCKTQMDRPLAHPLCKQRDTSPSGCDICGCSRGRISREILSGKERSDLSDLNRCTDPAPDRSHSITFAFFCLSALDLLDDTLSNESKIPGEEKKSYIEWIYALQCRDGGFTGSPSLPVAYSSGHLAMTYTALLCLALLRDDFSQLDRASLTSLLHALQQPDGSFAPTKDATHECDPRFTFCAFAICWIVNDWSGVDVETACGFLERCRAYDGAYAQGPGQESHGGSTYCVLASLSLAGKVEGDKRLVGWLLARQAQHDEKRDEEGDDNEEEDSSSSNEDGGDGTSTHIPTPLGAFNGRINKPGDSCYSFWCGASLDVRMTSVSKPCEYGLSAD